MKRGLEGPCDGTLTDGNVYTSVVSPKDLSQTQRRFRHVEQGEGKTFTVYCDGNRQRRTH